MSEMRTLTEEHHARMAWARIAEPDDKTARAMIADGGFLEALERARAGVSGLPRANAERFAARLRDLSTERDLEITERVGAVVLFPDDAQWPCGVNDLENPPWCLWVRGSGVCLASVTQRSAAIVGARASTSYGEYVAAELASGLAARDFMVVSGAAFGIDAAAHRGTLASDGVTVAVLAGGVERPYPAAHASLIARIAEVGAVVSEVPPGSAPTRSRFLARNRLIAALSVGTVLVEAGLRSGARSTVTAAIDVDRPVAAVPGPVTSMVSAGCHEEIRKGRAVLVTDAAEVAELFGRIGADLAEPKHGERRPSDGLDEDVFRVWQSLPSRRSITVEALTSAAGLGVIDVVGALGQLEAADLAKRTHRGWTRCTP
ncbi:MAG: DNA-processing protein DprA [Ornithinimicrobium sp.]